MAQIQIDWSRCATVPRQHQKDGVLALLKNPRFILADQVGAGKSKQVVDTSQILAEVGSINHVLVLAPAFARSVWASADPALGEVAKHGWPSIANHIFEYSVRNPKVLSRIPKGLKDLTWLVSNYEFIRRDERLAPLLAYVANTKFWLVCDEAWALKDAKTEQWKAVNKLRKLASRLTLLNGTPIADDPLDIYAQMKLIDPDHKIQPIKYFSHFRNYYAILKPNVSFPMITGWQHLEELSQRCAPFILQRQTRDCFDLPPVLDPITIEAKLSDESWRLYKQMRDEMVTWLELNESGTGGVGSVARQAIVKSMRLAQITSGFLGGIQEIDFGADELQFGMDPEDFEEHMAEALRPKNQEPPREIGREKLDAVIDWLGRIKPTPGRLLIWCRFRLEVERTAAALSANRTMHLLYGGQAPADRQAAVAALNPDVQPQGLVGVVGNPLAGGAALNLAGAALAITMSHDTKLRVYLQARGRIDRPGQRNPICYVDVVATGPKGQKTIDHHVLSALRNKEDIANWTAANWRQKLTEE